MVVVARSRARTDAFRAHERAERQNRRPPAKLVTTRLDQVMIEPVRWLLPGWVPIGMVSLLVGMPGCGKSTWSLRLAADVSTGALDVPGDVLVISYEDSMRHTLGPRLRAAGADRTRVHLLSVDQLDQVVDLTAHLDQIERVAQATGARLLIVDPLVAGLPHGSVDSHRDQSVRSALAPLVGMADRLHLAVLATIHGSKTASSALLAASGSVGFAALARSILVFGVDPTDERGSRGPARILAHAKCNVGIEQRSRRAWVLSTTVPGDMPGAIVATSMVELGDECDVHADELVRPSGQRGNERREAFRFLKDLLADGPHRASEVYDLAEGAGITKRTLLRAKADLSVISYQRRDEDQGKTEWWWELDESTADEPPDEDGDEDDDGEVGT